MLLSLPASLSIAKAMQLIKGGSSKWIHENFPDQRFFGWQEKYGAFSVSVSQLDPVARYIQGQAEHHRKLTFKEEFLVLLKKHQIAYDPKYLWEYSAVPVGTYSRLPLVPALKRRAGVGSPCGTQRRDP